MLSSQTTLLINLDEEITMPLPYMCPTCVSAEGLNETIDNGGVDRARAVARILVWRGVWDGVSAITVIDPYYVHDRLDQRWVRVEKSALSTIVTAADAPAPIRGNSPLETDLDPQIDNVPDSKASKQTVRDIIDQIHTAAHDHLRDVPGARDAQYILKYIQRKETEAFALVRSSSSLYKVVNYIKATREVTADPSVKIKRIEKIAANALAVLSQVVQS